MKYIKSKIKFINESEEESAGEKLQFQLRDYNSKKDNLKNLLLSNALTDKDISKNFKDIVGDNPFLQQYGNMLSIEVGILNKENNIKEISEVLDGLKKDLDLVGQLTDETDMAEQQKRIEEQINDKSKDIKDNKEGIEELRKKLEARQVEFKDFINVKTSELEEIQKSPFVSEDILNTFIEEVNKEVVNIEQNPIQEPAVCWNKHLKKQ